MVDGFLRGGFGWGGKWSEGGVRIQERVESEPLRLARPAWTEI